MGNWLTHRPAWYTMSAAAATVLAVGTGGLVAATSAAASPATSGGAHCNTSITKENFGTANSGPYGGNQTVWRYTLTNSHCMQVRIITYGATVQSISVPDRHGHVANVALGFKTLAEYVNLDSPPPTSPNFGGPYFGETIGRYANRIGGASFKLERDDLHAARQQRAATPCTAGSSAGGTASGRTRRRRAGTARVSLTMSLVAPNGDEGSGLLPGTNNYEPNCSIPSAPATTCTGFPAQVTT